MGKKSNRSENLLYLSLIANVGLIYYIIGIRQELAYQATHRPSALVPTVDLHRDLEYVEQNVKYNKYPSPVEKLKDSARVFFVDHGTYSPAKSATAKHAVVIAPSECSSKTKLVIGIKTVINNVINRNAIRRTWGNMTNYDLFPARLVFLSGRDALLGTETDKKYAKEAEFDDILLGDFTDSFHNLTYKDSMFFTWARHACGSIEYVFKGDDDTLINPFELQRFIKIENATTPALYGSKLSGQPVQRVDMTSSGRKYGDEKWPEKTYPTYVSGGGFLMNRLAMDRIQEMIRITPMIPIDDAFIGICMRRAGLENNIIMDGDRFKSWGFKPFEEKRFEVCKIETVIFYHKFTPKELDCFWPKFLANRAHCTEPDFKYVEDFPLCNPKDWHKNHQVGPPKLDGPDYHHCGPDWDNAGCSLDPNDWKIRQPNNGPCCSPNGYCGITKDHCDCVDCVDFRKVEKEKNQMEAHKAGICCHKLAIQSAMTYAGTYRIKKENDKKTVHKDENGNVEYDVISGSDKFRIAYGGFSVYGTGWYVLAPAGGGLAWNIKDASQCPPFGEWEGYGAVVSCLD